MKALLVIDVQNAILNVKDFGKEITNIKQVVTDFKAKDEPVIFIRNISDEASSPFYKNSDNAKIHPSLEEEADLVIDKRTPSAFFETNLEEKLKEFGIDHIFITGFNTEFCCQFTAIAGYDRGYQVTFIEDATGTVNDEEVYEMQGLDIPDFVGTVLHWSNVIEVLDMSEYVEIY